MKFLCFTYLAEGRNRSTVINRLNRAGVGILRMRIIDEKHTEITISHKDREKYFAICKNMWYNHIIKTSGFAAPLYKLWQKPWQAAGALVFAALAFFGSNLYAGTEYRGDALIFRAEVERAFEESGITLHGFFNESKLESAKKLLEERLKLSFIKIEKSGNRAIITVYSSEDGSKKLISSDIDVVASDDCEILKITAYSGTALVSDGDKVAKGQTLIAAYEVLKDGSTVPCRVTGCITAKYAFSYRYECVFDPDETAVKNALACARFALGDYTVIGQETNIEEKYVIVTLYYEKLLFGNEVFGG